MNWYECQLQQVNTWLEKRPPFSLHPEQLTAIFTLKEVRKEGEEERGGGGEGRNEEEEEEL